MRNICQRKGFNKYFLSKTFTNSIYSTVNNATSCIFYCLSYLQMMREFLPGMLKRNHGHVVAISSVASLGAGPNGSAYIATKWATTGKLKLFTTSINISPHGTNLPLRVSTHGYTGFI